MVRSVEYYYFLSPMGISFNEMDRGEMTIRLALQMHRERKKHGREVSDWDREFVKIVNAPLSQDSTLSRLARVHFCRGIQHLQRGHHGDFVEAMKKSASGEGRFAERARWILRLAWVSPLLRVAFSTKVASFWNPFLRYRNRLPGKASLESSIPFDIAVIEEEPIFQAHDDNRQALS